MTTEHFNKLADWHQAMADEPKRNQAKREKHAETARILRAAGAADVQGLMAKAMRLVSAVDESCNKVSSVPFAEAVAALESALRVALAPKAEPHPNTAGGAFFKQCTAFTAPAAQPGAQEPAK